MGEMTNYCKQLDVLQEFLTGQGMTVLERCYNSTAFGSVDFVAADHGVLVVVVIVSRIPNEMGRMGAIRLRKIAVEWMNTHGVRYDQVRADVAQVTLLPHGQSNLEYVKAMA